MRLERGKEGSVKITKYDKEGRGVMRYHVYLFFVVRAISKPNKKPANTYKIKIKCNFIQRGFKSTHESPFYKYTYIQPRNLFRELYYGSLIFRNLIRLYLYFKTIIWKFQYTLQKYTWLLVWARGGILESHHHHHQGRWGVKKLLKTSRD